MNYAGIDVSKDSFNYFVMDEKYEEIKSGKLGMNQEGFEEFKSVVSGIKDSVIGMESTGNYHANLLSFTISFKKEAYLINPQLIKRFSQGTTLRKTKTDEIDARIIALFMAKNHELLTYFSPDNIDEIRVIARIREDLSRQISTAKTKFKQHINAVFPELLIESNVYSASIMNLLKIFPSAEAVRNADIKEIKDAIMSKRGKSINLSAKDIKELAKNSIGKSSENFKMVIKLDIRTIEFLELNLKEITDSFIDQIKKSNHDDLDIISSIKGISDITACHFIAEVKDIKRFPTRNKLIAFAGTDPSIRQSGTSVNSNGKISKKGSRTLRRYLFLMGQSLIVHNPNFKEYYEKKKKEGMPYRKAMIALCNKLLRILYALLTKRQTYNESLNKSYI
jgi:transposase